MSRDAEQLRLMAASAAVAQELVRRAVDERGFVADEILQHAAASIVIAMGEAAARLTPELRERHPEVPWRRIIGARNVVAHGYLTVDWSIVWRALTDDVPSLAILVERILASEFPGEEG